MLLKDRVVIITGAAQGIGKAYALRCDREGAKLVLADIQDARPVADEIRALEVNGRVNGGAEVLALQFDISDEPSTEMMARETVQRFGRIDVLVNNAAVSLIENMTDFWRIPSADWDRVLAVNVKGTFLCVKAVLPQMRKQEKGTIIIITSGVVFMGAPGMLSYVSSKGALVSMTRSMARELGPFNIAVNSISPGFVLSDGILAKPEQVATKNEPQKKTRCFQRDQFPEDLTGALVYLASDDSDFVTGQIVTVDGGSVMH